MNRDITLPAIGCKSNFMVSYYWLSQ